MCIIKYYSIKDLIEINAYNHGIIIKIFLGTYATLGGGGRACLRDAMMYMFCLLAHRFICIIFIWPTFFSKKYQSPRVTTYNLF